MPLIDIAIPNYNYGRYLRSCVESVTSQGVESLRILIIDNASSDDSADIARSLAASDSRIELRLRDKNLGPHASFNEAIDWAQSRYFVILCADDILLPGSLSQFVSALDRHPEANLAFGPTLFRDDRSISLPSKRPRADCRVMAGRELLDVFCRTGRNPVDGPMAVVRTEAQKRVGCYNTALPHTDDAEMWMRFSLIGDAIEFADPMTITRIHGSNQSRVLSTVHHWNVAMEAAFDAFFARHGAAVPGAGRLHQVARRSLSDRAYWCAVSSLARGEPGTLQLFRFALRLRPTALFMPPLGRLLKDRSAWDKARAIIMRRKQPRPRAV